MNNLAYELLSWNYRHPEVSTVLNFLTSTKSMVEQVAGFENQQGGEAFFRIAETTANSNDCLDIIQGDLNAARGMEDGNEKGHLLKEIWRKLQEEAKRRFDIAIEPLLASMANA
ncbi:MAG: hypothetical protein SGARI_007061, partial [Bacillariaceae sp.]